MSPPHLKRKPKSGDLWVIAHRGYKALYPENTLSAFNAALDAGADMIELDVMLTGDRRIIVIHDPSLERTTDGAGSVNLLTLEELKRLDAGKWFGPQFAGERLPTLEEVLTLLGDRILINIEIKGNAYEPEAPPDALERQVLELVEERGLTRSVLISSFDARILERIVEMGKGAAVALIAGDPAENGLLEICRRLKVFSFHPNGIYLKREHVDRMHDAGFLVFPYNVDTEEQCRIAKEKGVDGVITNDPLLPRKAHPGL